MDRASDSGSEGWGFESLPVCQDKRTDTRMGIRSFILSPERDSKGRLDRREGKKVSGGHFFSPWESPWMAERNP